MPQISEARCRACVMLGGTLVASKRDAAEFTNALGRTVEVDELLEEEPCQPAHILEEIQRMEGRPCPRVPLLIENAEALELISVLLREDLRPMAPVIFDATCGDLSRDHRARMLRRVRKTLQEPEVNEFLNPKTEKR